MWTSNPPRPAWTIFLLKRGRYQLPWASDWWLLAGTGWVWPTRWEITRTFEASFEIRQSEPAPKAKTYRKVAPATLREKSTLIHVYVNIYFQYHFNYNHQPIAKLEFLFWYSWYELVFNLSSKDILFGLTPNNPVSIAPSSSYLTYYSSSGLPPAYYATSCKMRLDTYCWRSAYVWHSYTAAWFDLTKLSNRSEIFSNRLFYALDRRFSHSNHLTCD